MHRTTVLKNRFGIWALTQDRRLRISSITNYNFKEQRPDPKPESLGGRPSQQPCDPVLPDAVVVLTRRVLGPKAATVKPKNAKTFRSLNLVHVPPTEACANRAWTAHYKDQNPAKQGIRALITRNG